MLTRGGLLIVCLLLPGLPLQVAAASRLADYDSHASVLSAADIHTLAAGLKDAPQALRAEFASAVLTEMILDYRQEAERARAEVRRHAADRELLRWSRAVEGLVADLQRLADSITPETPVFVSAHYEDAVYLVVDGSPVLLTGPRSSENASLEERVVQRFCSRNACADLVEEDMLARPGPAETGEPPLWRFGDAAGPACATGDGLELQFQDTSGLAGKREACSMLVAELNALAAAVKLKISTGTRIDWNRVAVRPSTGAGVQTVVLNAEGDFVLLPVPNLERSQELFRLVLPWLAAKVAGQRYNLVVLNTERLLGMPEQPAE